MGFLRGLMKKDQPDKGDDKKKGEKDPLSRESAARPTDKNRMNPIAGHDSAAPLSKSGTHKTPERKLTSSGQGENRQQNKSLKSALSGEAGVSITKNVAEQHKFVHDADILDALAAELNMEKVSLTQITVTEELLAQLPKKVARDLHAFPVSFDHNEVVVAISDPMNIQAMDDLSRIIGKPVRTVVASEDEIARFYQRHYEGSEIENIYTEMTDDLTQRELDEQHSNEIELDESDNEEAPPVVKFVDLVFKRAVLDRASDIHIEPTRDGITIRFRIDGVLHEMPSPPKKWQNSILSRLKVLSGMDLAEKRIPQDGRIKLSLPDRKLDLRVNSLPAINGETIVMRILDQSSVLLGLEDVGFLPDNITLFNNLIRTPTGVILMTGPTGSGKTTTLYSALSTLNSPEIKIVTIENPVEYMLEGVNQVQVMEEIGLDFTTGLRSILRQSPDVLLVGEMRDLETAEIGIRAALTGHLVFSTLHTNDAPSAPGRLVDMGVKPFLVASALQAVVAQRLVRRLCGSCKKETSPTQDQLIEIAATKDEIENIKEFPICTPVGCERCSDGFRGRTAIHEILVVDSRVRQLIIKGESGFRIKKAALRNGMRSLRMDGWEKVKLGQTSISEILRITQDD
ncbi:MAG: type II/IV secretion system protein [Candidatus Sumerlaeia bacterium]|nr:type II/IV secretion system protein [Candidatus Sumerlaeia bacterium]